MPHIYKFHTKLALLLTSRYALFSFNVLFVTIAVVTIVDCIELSQNQVNDFEKINNLLNGIAVILVAYGVALEERDTLMKFFNIYPDFYSDQQNRIDRICHFYGLLILLTGLLMETVIETSKLPSRIMNTEAKEGIIFVIGLLFCFFTIVLLVRHCYLVVKLPEHFETD